MMALDGCPVALDTIGWACASAFLSITVTITAEFYIAPPTKWTGALNNKSYAYE